MSASEWRSDMNVENRKNGKRDSNSREMIGKIGEDFDISSSYIRDRTQTRTIWRIKMKDRNQFTVEVKDLPEFNVAYVRHIGPYKAQGDLFDRLIGKLMTWAGPH